MNSVLNGIIIKFKNKIKGQKFEKTNKSQDGSEGHWLEKQLDLKVNNKNEPDYQGYEIKIKSNVISFGDWSADGYIFQNNEIINNTNQIKINLSRDEFMKLFGHYNQKRNRFSWSGSCIPKLNQWNFNGTMMRFNKKNDLIIKYRYSKDKRNNKITLMPNIFRENTNKSFLIVYWSYNKLKNHIEKKFNQKGFILFEKNKENIYYKMLIGKTINFNIFKNLMEKDDIIFDSGMHQGNFRNYSHFRAKDSIWKKLVFEEIT